MVQQAVSPRPSVQMLSAAECATLTTICETLLPALAAEADDDPRLFALAAATLGVDAAMEQAIGALDAAQQAQFRQLLRALEQPLVVALLVGKAQPFSRLDHANRERALRAMATSHLPLFRAGFQGLKRLATFLFYTLTYGQGNNPTWPAIGYTPSTNPPARSSPLTLTPITRPVTLDCDACVIGSGAGGSVVAAELAAAGKRVIVLEAGSGQQAPDFDQRELMGMQRLYLDQGMTATRDLGVAILAGATLGGGTTVNWQTSLRLPDTIRDEWASLSGCQHFADVSFTRSLDAVAARLNVDRDESVVNANNAMLRDGCATLGYRWTTLPRNADGCDPAQCGACVFGCRHGGKQSTSVTYLRDAQRYDAIIIADCRADRVRIANGRVNGVAATATDPATGREYTITIRAPLVVVAAGALHSPALLLRSGLDHPQLGRNLFLHPTSAVSGTYDALIEPWRGPPQTILSDQFAALDGAYGVRLETAPAHPGLLALATPWINARQHRRDMQQAAHKSTIIVLTRDRTGGRVRVNRRGQPVIDYRPGAVERAYLQRGIAEAIRVHLAAGAHEVLTLHTREQRLNRTQPLTAARIDAFCDHVARLAVERNWSTIFSAHQMGTCRMGRDPRAAVCDANGEVFGVRGLFIADGSAFPASSGTNPMLTIMALAHHTAQCIKARYR